MNILLLTITVILSAKIEIISSVKAGNSCYLYDFSDPLVISEFSNCNRSSSQSSNWTLKSYNNSNIVPFRPNSGYYLYDGIYVGAIPCWNTEQILSLPVANYVIEMAIYGTDFIGQLLANSVYFEYQINDQVIRIHPNPVTALSSWEVIQTNFRVSQSGPQSLRITKNVKYADPSRFVAIEYIKIFNPLLTDGSCDFNPITPPKNPSCMNIDFNQPTSVLSEMQECNGLHLPKLMIKSYSNTTIPSYRETSTHHLSTEWEGISCTQSTAQFSLNNASRISSAIYLDAIWPHAWVVIYVYDELTGDRQVVLSVESSSKEWRSLTGDVNRKFENAKIVVETNANVRNGLAIEYLNIIDTNSTTCLIN